MCTTSCASIIRRAAKFYNEKNNVNSVAGGMADRGDSVGGLTMLRNGAHYVHGVLS